jgi:serine/threonine protein kinase
MSERFTLLTELGRGGMGVVWKARDEETGQIVALKLMREAYAEDPEYLARFERELELAKRIDSVHVVKVLGFGVRQKVPYLALEYVDGPSLHDALAQHGPYSWPETRALLIQLTQGLADANAAGVIHRDVKPSNVLIGPDGIAKVTDFGIARGLDTTRMTATSTMLGTPAYLAPEGPKDARSDLYSLGIIGYQLLTGAAPFAGSTYQEVIVRHIREAPDLAKLPLEARDIVGWLLAKEPAERPQRASQLMAALYGAVPAPKGEAGVVVAPPTQPVSAPPPIAQFKRVPPQPAPAEATPIRPPTAISAERQAPVPTAHEVRRKSTPIMVGPGAVALLVCLFAVSLAVAGGLARRASSPSSGASGTFSPTGSMAAARGSHTATLLSDGRVLISGGYNDSEALSTAELYDPKAGTFSPTGSMAAGRKDHTATLLSDGRVLIAGGRDSSGRVFDSAEIYAP